MTTTVIEDVLRDHPFTREFWPEQITRLADLGSEARFRSGELIFHEGDHSSLFYLLLSGSVALEIIDPGRPVRVSTVYSGEALGWSSLTGSDDKQFQARALEEVHALAFDGTRLRHACEEDYAFGYAVMRAVLAATADRLHAVRAQLVHLYAPVEVATS
jgi:CRP/FNR family transcriptional regulator, cyclic AMP receptor protein